MSSEVDPATLRAHIHRPPMAAWDVARIRAARADYLQRARFTFADAVLSAEELLRETDHAQETTHDHDGH